MEWREPFDFFFKFRAPLCKWYLRTLLFGILEQKVPKSVMHVYSYFLVHKSIAFDVLVAVVIAVTFARYFLALIA